MSSVATQGPKAYLSAWKGAAKYAAVHYVFSVATIVWFLSLSPTGTPVLASDCVDTMMPTTISMAATNAKLIRDVFRQGLERVVNLFVRTSGKCTPAQTQMTPQRLLQARAQDIIDKEQSASARETEVAELEKDLAKTNDTLARARKALRDIQLQPKTPKREARLEVEAKSVQKAKAAQSEVLDKLRTARAEQKDSIRAIVAEARASALSVRSCTQYRNIEIEEREAEDLRTGQQQCLDKVLARKLQNQPQPLEDPQPQAPTRARQQAGGDGTRATKAGPQSGHTATGENAETVTSGKGPADTQEALAEAKEIEKDLTFAVGFTEFVKRMCGCDTPFEPVTLTNIQEHLNTLVTSAIELLKPTTMIDIDTQQMAGKFEGTTPGGKTVEYAFGAAPLKAPKGEGLASGVLALFRPIVYGILGVMFAIYLAYTLVGIPFAWLMNGIRDIGFTKQGKKIPLWKYSFEQVFLFLLQLTIAFWTFPLWFILGGSVWFFAALFIFTPLAFASLTFADRPRHQILYYAAISALPLSLVGLAHTGKSYLFSKLPSHSELPTATAATWWALAVAAVGAGARATTLEGAGHSPEYWKPVAWSALALMVALPPISVMIEQAM
jgi:hypothetical protein